MRFRTIAAPAALVAILACACTTPAAPPTIGQPGYCGQTADGKATVALVGSTNCDVAGKANLRVDENCGPLVEGSNATDDCYRGNGPKGPGYYRAGTLVAPYTRERLIATDAAYFG